MNNSSTSNKPNCYNENEFSYPLCKGQKEKEECTLCNLYEDMGDIE